MNSGVLATPAPATEGGVRREAPVIPTVDAAARHAAGPACYQAAVGGWPTDLPVGLAR